LSTSLGKFANYDFYWKSQLEEEKKSFCFTKQEGAIILALPKKTIKNRNNKK
jgi:hypothetical protein